jgi:hypothetical protein
MRADSFLQAKGQRPERLAQGRPLGAATGDFSDAKVIRKFGDAPDDLCAL